MRYGARCAGRKVGRGAGAGASVARTRRSRDWGQGTRGGAHHEHAVHERDAGRVEAHRLVETVRSLCRVEGRECETRVRCAGRKARGRGAWGSGGGKSDAHAEDPRLEGLGQGTRGERTKNMLAMVVTPEVSQLETSALKFAMS